MRERRFPMASPGNKASGDAHAFTFIAVAEDGDRLRSRVRTLVSIGIGRDTALFQAGELVAPRLQHEVEIFAHAAALPSPNFFR